jgi:hypothetical protein
VCKVFGLASYSYVADRRNRRVKTDYGYLNYIFTVIWLITFTVGLPVQIIILVSAHISSKVLFIAEIIYFTSLYTSSFVAVVWVSVIKRRMFLEIIGNILEVDNKIRYSLQEETHMNRKVFFIIITEFILLTVILGIWILYNIYRTAIDPYYIIIMHTINFAPDFVNALIVFQFVNLVFMLKQRYSHLNNRLTYWLNMKVSRPIYLKKQNERRRQSERAVDNVFRTSVYVSSVEHIEGNITPTDIHLLRQIYSELYDITYLINDTYGIPILAIVCCLLAGVVFTLYQVLINFDESWGLNLTYVLMCTALFFKVTLFCHTATNEARSSRIVVEKLLLGRNCRNEIIEELKMFSLQLQAMTNQYTACGFFSLNLKFFTCVVSAIASYIVIMVQIK